VGLFYYFDWKHKKCRAADSRILFGCFLPKPVTAVEGDMHDEIAFKALDRETSVIIGGPPTLYLDSSGPAAIRIYGDQIVAGEIHVGLITRNALDE
jgi:hypothetical protein